MDQGVQQGWLEFIKEAQAQIFPIYEEHEHHFDGVGIHGRMHISRALIFAEVMSRLYLDRQQEVDLYAVRVAVAFHDAGRQGNGKDVWESASAALCREYVLSKANAEYALQVSKSIEKGGGDWDIQQRIVHDADVLEIMRPCCGHGGIQGFQQDNLRFAGKRDPQAALFEKAAVLRARLIQEAWQWIQATEEIKYGLSASKTYLEDVLKVLKTGQKRYPLLASIL
jgi:hypothetical protein